MQVDPYTHAKYVHSPKFNLEWPKGYGFCFLSANADKDGKLYSLVLFAKHLNWVFLDSASDRNGNTFQVVKMDSQADSGWCEESVTVMLTKFDLEEAALVGLDIKVIGKRGDVVVVLPASYVSGFLAKANEEIQ